VDRAEAAGSVYNLSKLEEFSGSYTAAVGAAMLRGDAGVIALKNEHGVVIVMKRITQGASLKSAASGIKLRVTDEL